MATGKSTQLTRQIGEHLIVSMLGRKGIIATPFAGNVPDFDILASDVNGNIYPIQVKAIKGASWQLSATSFLDINFDKKLKTQIVNGKKLDCNVSIIFILVRLGENEIDEFYVLKMEEIQNIIMDIYNGESRPKNWESTHCAIWPKHLADYKEGWKRIDKIIKTS
jgi:hypothetical protein